MQTGQKYNLYKLEFISFQMQQVRLKKYYVHFIYFLIQEIT